jgi:fatty acid desaturase
MAQETTAAGSATPTVGAGESTGFFGSLRKERRSVWTTNLALLALNGALGLLLGFGPAALVALAVMVPASIIGVWLFSLQHRFEGASWSRHAEWDPVTAAMEGSSFLRLPPVLQWLTGSIGFHHVHHLAPRVPDHRLEECHLAHPAFAAVRVLTLKDGLRAFRYVLWDECAGRMVTFAEAGVRAPAAGPPVAAAPPTGGQRPTPTPPRALLGAAHVSGRVPSTAVTGAVPGTPKGRIR